MLLIYLITLSCENGITTYYGFDTDNKTHYRMVVHPDGTEVRETISHEQWMSVTQSGKIPDPMSV